MFGAILLFSILGLFVWFISRKSSTPFTADNHSDRSEDEDYLRKSIRELESVLRNSPDKTVKGLLEDYKNQLEKRTQGGLVLKSDNASHTISVSPHKEISFSNWYSKNSINLLLYVGAFLIVTSASIFVGFAWETLSGVIKASVLSSVAIAFFGFGMWFFKIPKIRDAGNTFIAIGAVLIPVCGSAWSNFVFKPMGVEQGVVWLGVSMIALLVYVYLAFGYRNKFYTYASAIASLSLISSLVSTFRLDGDFYILAGIATSFILMILTFVSRKQNKEVQDFTLIPLQVSSQILMPLALGAGFLIAGGENKLFTFEAVLSGLLGAAFYVFSYLYFKKPMFMALSEVLFSCTIILFFFWQKFDNSLLLYVLNFCAFGYLYKAFILKKYNLNQESEISLAVGLTQTILVVPFAFALQVDPIHTAFLSLMPGLAGIALAYVKNEVRYLGISSIAIAVALPLFIQYVFRIQNYTDYLSYSYLVFGLIFYAVCIYLKNRFGSLQIFRVSALLFFSLSFAFGLSSETQRLISSLVFAGISIHYAWVFGIKEFIYVSNFFLMFASFNFLRLMNLDLEFYPFYYSVGAYLLYGMSFVKFPEGKNFQEAYRNSALVSALITPISGGIYSLDAGYSEVGVMERNSIISAYATTVLFGIDVAIKKVRNFGYITSVLGIAIVFWQMKYLGISESLVYTVSLGLYFMALAYTRKIKSDDGGRQLLDWVGLFALLVPPALASFGGDALKYSATVGISGILLLILGITIHYKLYKMAGVAGIVLAVLPETYSYILNFPKWLIIGVGGAIFITVAIVLSLKRKESD